MLYNKKPVVARINDRTAWQHAIFEMGIGTPILKERVRMGSAMVPLDRALVSSYRLSMVTMSLTETVWPQFAMHVFGGTLSTPPPFWGQWELYGVQVGTTG